MTTKIVVVFGDGVERPTIRNYTDFAEALEDAFDLADKHGRDPGDGNGPPERLQVVRDGTVELSIRVLRGGLVKPKAARQ